MKCGPCGGDRARRLQPALRPVAPARPDDLAQAQGKDLRAELARLPRPGRAIWPQAPQPADAGRLGAMRRWQSIKTIPLKLGSAPKPPDRGAARLPRARPLRRRIAAFDRACCVFFRFAANDRPRPARFLRGRPLTHRSLRRLRRRAANLTPAVVFLQLVSPANGPATRGEK